MLQHGLVLHSHHHHSHHHHHHHSHNENKSPSGLIGAVGVSDEARYAADYYQLLSLLSVSLLIHILTAVTT